MNKVDSQKKQGFTYDINNASIDKTSQRCLLFCHTLNNIPVLFLSTFLVGYIYQFQGDVYSYLFNVGVYNLFIYLTMLILAVPLSKLVDRSNRVLFYRLSLFVNTALVVFVVFYGQVLANYLILAGVVKGLADALYFMSYNVIKQEMVSRKSIKTYTVLVYIISKIIEVVCPVLLGLIIEQSTYSQMAIIVLCVSAVQIFLSFWIKSRRPVGSNFSLKGYYKKLKENKPAFKSIKLIYIICAIYGSVVLTTNLINVCIMLQFGSTFSLGILTSVFALASVLLLLLFKRFTKQGKRKTILLSCAIVPVIAGIVFVCYMTPATIIIFNGTISLSAIIFKYIFDVYRNGVLKETGLYSEIAEHHCTIELICEFSRIVCFGLLMLMALIGSLEVFKTFTVLSIFVEGIVVIILMHYEQIMTKKSSAQNTESALEQSGIEGQLTPPSEESSEEPFQNSQEQR